MAQSALSNNATPVLSSIGGGSGLADRVSRLLGRVDCRLAETDEQREAIFRLRYQAYRREKAISQNSSNFFFDQYDEKGNAFVFGFYIDGELASSIRVHVASRDYPEFTSLEAFSDVLQPELDAGRVIVDPTRFVTRERFSRLYRALPYVTLRVAGIACEYFGADHLLATVRKEHQAFYRRTFHHRLVCEARPYPGLTKPLSLMMMHYPKFSEGLFHRYPFFRSSSVEQRRFFARGGGVGSAPGPLARLAGPCSGCSPILEEDRA
jgi:hypothetical protein